MPEFFSRQWLDKLQAGCRLIFSLSHKSVLRLHNAEIDVFPADVLCMSSLSVGLYVTVLMLYLCRTVYWFDV